MYLEHFGLKLAPFQLTPDAGFLYLSDQHAKAKAHMDYAVLNRDSCVVVTGDIGCGKTTVINRFLRDTDEDVLIARIFQTQIDSVQFLQTLLAEFGISAFQKNKAELLSIVNQFLLEQNRSQRQVVLIVDEAQNLSMRVLEEIRLLTDIETEQAKAINVILCGQPELNDKLNDPVMAQLLQRVHFRVHVEPLNMLETSEYIAHRLAIAGRPSDDLIPAQVMPTIYRYTGGVPRLINTLCDTVLTAAYVDERDVIDEDIVQAAILELDWKPFSKRENRRYRDTFPEPDQAAKPKLIVLRDGEILSKFPMGERRALIGRDADNDLPIASDFISRHHAQISFYRGRYWVMDLKSTNGTYVNGKRIRRHQLRDKDVIAIGHHRLVYQDPGANYADDSSDKTTHLSDFQGTSVLDPSYGVAHRAAEHDDDSDGDGDDADGLKTNAS